MKKACSLFLSFALVLGLLPGAALAAEETAPFTALCGEEALTVTRSGEDYTYTAYDANWNPVEDTVALYEVAVPADGGDVTLGFGEEPRICYAYTADEIYITDCSGSAGGYADNGQTGLTTAAVAAPLPDFVRVQTPYDESWQSETLYAVTFVGADAGEEGEQSPADVSALLENIAGTYAEMTGIWDVVCTGMYESAYPEVTLLDEAARQTRVDAVLTSLQGERLTDGDMAKAILALRALGYDPRQLTAADGSKLDAVAMLNAAASDNIYNAPYVLLALQQGDYDAVKEQALLSFVLENQGEDGAWFTSPDTTGIMLTALKAYAGTEAVDAAMTAGAAYLKNAVSEAGTCGATWDGMTTYNADSTAMAVIGMSAAGVEAGEVAGESGVTLLEGLLSFALSDNSGFGYTDNTAWNSFATKDGFWALLCVDKGAEYALFDFTANPALPAAATGAPGDEGEDDGEQGGSADEITVFFELKTHLETWIEDCEVTVAEESTVADVFFQVLDGLDGFDYEDRGGYISSVTCGDETWAEFDAGLNSGWKYKVNGKTPGVGMGDMVLEDGDEILWYYVTDYKRDDDWEEPSVQPEQPEPPELPFTDAKDHWAYEAIAYCCEAGVMAGTSETTFSPDAELTRGMVAAILYAMEGKPGAEGENPFADVPAGQWYTDAVLWCAEKGVVSGYAGSFVPEAEITREQLAAMLWKYAQYQKRDVSVGEETNILSYTDALAISDWAFPGLQWACGSGLMGGYAGAIMPQGLATRGETAVMLMNYLEN